MGFMDKLKSVGRMLGGGGAKVYVEAGPATLNQPFAVKIKAQVGEADLKIEGVYLLVKAQEEVKVSGSTVETSIRTRLPDFTVDSHLSDIVERDTTCDFKVNVSGPAELSANEEYEWDAEVSFPSGAAPSFQGRNCSHVWEIQAGLDAFGNDPDSGWVEIQVMS